MRFNGRLFLILWTAGVVGVLSFLLVDLKGLIALLPVPADSEPLEITPALKVLSLIQPSVLISIAVLIGVYLAPKVQLEAPFAQSLASGGDKSAAIRPQIAPGIIGGILGGLAIVLTGLASRQFLSPSIIQRMTEFGEIMPLPTRLLYGGITEELLLRWGVMTLLVWVGWRLFQKGNGAPRAATVIAAILISSILFAVGHLPLARLLFPEAGHALTVFVLIGNSTFGIVAGYLYWKKGLESAMIAHAVAHLVMYAASAVDAYF